MRTHRAFTLIELLVVIAVIAVLMAILMPALNRAREQGKRAVCMGHIKQMGLSWVLYADENDQRIVNACTVANTEGHNDTTEPCWLYFNGNTGVNTEADRIKGVQDGAFWPYVKQLKIYKCPTGMRGEVNTYGIVDSMNGAINSLVAQSGVPRDRFIKTRTQIKRPGERLVFVDEGKTSTQSWTIHYNQPSWWDGVPLRHGLGTNLSFADGHAEYWKWEDDRTRKFAQQEGDWQQYRVAPGNPDLRRMQNACWGDLGYVFDENAQ
jgi:prepilin-type N-terminal cleavage/methylation domain-containing protein/prepilin-type processing-associated H-X9-DG protein